MREAEMKDEGRDRRAGTAEAGSGRRREGEALQRTARTHQDRRGRVPLNIPYGILRDVSEIESDGAKRCGGLSGLGRGVSKAGRALNEFLKLRSMKSAFRRRV